MRQTALYPHLVALSPKIQFQVLAAGGFFNLRPFPTIFKMVDDDEKTDPPTYVPWLQRWRFWVTATRFWTRKKRRVKLHNSWASLKPEKNDGKWQALIFDFSISTIRNYLVEETTETNHAVRPAACCLKRGTTHTNPFPKGKSESFCTHTGRLLQRGVKEKTILWSQQKIFFPNHRLPLFNCNQTHYLNLRKTPSWNDPNRQKSLFPFLLHDS